MSFSGPAWSGPTTTTPISTPLLLVHLDRGPSNLLSIWQKQNRRPAYSKSHPTRQRRRDLKDLPIKPSFLGVYTRDLCSILSSIGQSSYGFPSFQTPKSAAGRALTVEKASRVQETPSHFFATKAGRVQQGWMSRHSHATILDPRTGKPVSRTGERKKRKPGLDGLRDGESLPTGVTRDPFARLRSRRRETQQEGGEK